MATKQISQLRKSRSQVLLNVLEEPLETAYMQAPQALPCASSWRVPRLHLRPVGRVVREACAEAGCGVQ